MIGAQRSISLSSMRSAAAGVALSSDIGSVLMSLKRFTRSGSLSAVRSAVESFADDGRRQSFRREQAVPHAKLEALQAGFVGGRQVRQRFQPRLGGDRIALHLLAQDRAGGVGGLVAAQVDLLADQIVHHRPGAAIRHRRDLRLGFRQEQHAAQMRRRADAGVAHARLDAGLLQIDRPALSECWARSRCAR